MQQNICDLLRISIQIKIVYVAQKDEGNFLIRINGDQCSITGPSSCMLDEFQSVIITKLKSIGIMHFFAIIEGAFFKHPHKNRVLGINALLNMYHPFAKVI